MRSEQLELHNTEVVTSEREYEQYHFEQQEEEEEEYESEYEECSEEHESMKSSALCFTPEVSDELSELVDREIIPCLVPSERGMERRRHQLEQLASCITEAIRCVNDQDDDHFPSTMDNKDEEENTNKNTCHDGFGDIRFFIFGSVNMRTVLPDGDNDVTIEVDGLLSPHKTNQIVYPPNPLVITPLEHCTTEQSPLLTEHESLEQLANKQTNSSHEPLCQAVTEDANFVAENNRLLSHDTTTPHTTNTSIRTNNVNKNVNSSNKKTFTNVDDVNSANASVLPVTTDSNAANVDGSLQLGTLADGRPIYAPPAALTIAGNELLSKVRDYLVHEQQRDQEHEHHDSHDSNVAVHSHHPLDEYADVNGPSYISNTNISNNNNNNNNSSNNVMTQNEVDTTEDVYEEIKENHNITNLADNHKLTCSETHSSSNYIDNEHDKDVYDNREQKCRRSNSICKCKKIPEIFVEAFVPAEVRVLKVVMEGCSYDLTINQFGGVNCVRFLHEMDRLIGHAHLLKRTLLLLKSWASYEAHILGGQGGYLSSYAVTIMLIALLNTVDFVEDENDDDFRVISTQRENCETYDSKQTENSDKNTDSKEEIACDHNGSTSFHNSLEKRARKYHTKPHTHHGRTTSITPLKLIARFIKFYRYFDYDTYCVTAFGALKLSVLSEHINNKIPLDLSCLEASVTMENHSRKTKSTEIEREETTATEQDCKTSFQFPDKHNHQHNTRSNVSVRVQDKNNSKINKNDSSDYDEALYDVLPANTNKIINENVNYLDINDLGLTNEGKELFGLLIRRRTPPLFTVQEIKYLLHEMNTERESERWNWFTSTHSHVTYGKVFEIQADRTSIKNKNSNNDYNSAIKRHSDNVKEGIELTDLNSNNNISESIQCSECEKGQAITQHSTPMEEHHYHVYDEDRANLHSGWVKRAAVDDTHLICPSCNVLLFPIRSMNVLDPLRWSSNMVRGICRNHAQRILKAFSEGLTRFARASSILRRSHMRRTMCEPVRSNNEDTSHYGGTLQTEMATPTSNTEMKSANMTSAISNMESTSNLSNKSTSINDHTHSNVLLHADMRWHIEKSYHSCSNHSNNSNNNINDNSNNANLPTLQCTEAERKVLHYLFGNTIHMIHKYSDVNFPWDNLNHVVAEAEHELQSKYDKEEKSSQSKEQNYSNDTEGHDWNEHGKGEMTSNGVVKNESSQSCQTCFIPSILCVPDISCMCAAQCVFTNSHKNSKSTQLYGTSDKETVVAIRDKLNREVTSSNLTTERCKRNQQDLYITITQC